MLYKDGNALCRRQDKELLRIEPFGMNSFRIRATQLCKFNDDSLSALISESDKPDADIQIDGDIASIQNGNIRCEVLCTGKLKFYNQKGELLTEEYYKNRFGKVAPGEPESALEVIPRTFRPHRGTDQFEVEVRFEAKEGERFYGMGQYAQPYLNLKGCVLELSQRNSQVSIPFVLSNRGYGMLWNNPAIGEVAFGKNVTKWTAYSTTQIDYWITAGDKPSEIEEHYANATGKVPKMPHYATGLWQSKLRYRTQDEVLQVAREYKKRGLPLSVIVIDFFHWTAQGDWKFDPKYWPEPEKMVKELKDMGVELMVSVWPTVESRSENYRYMEDMGYLIRTEGGPRLGIKNKDTYMDATNPDARKFVWEKLKKNYYDKGIHLFWLDECEPELTRYEYDNYRMYLGADLEVGNIYPKKIAEMAYEGLTENGEENVVSLIRCAWAGSQRYGTLVWTGDISSNFKSLRNQIAAGLNMGLAGMPWWTTDIGGFHGGDVRDERFKECLVRWFEFATFCPVLRMHGFREPKVISKEGASFIPGDATSWDYTSGSPNEIWSYGEKTYEILKYYLLLREKIRPYIDGLMEQAHKTGTPLMRPLFYDYPDDLTAWDIEDSYMFGPDLVVCPITEEGCTSRNVYLPEGEWINIHTGERMQGMKTVECNASLNIIPVFAKPDMYKKYFI